MTQMGQTEQISFQPRFINGRFAVWVSVSIKSRKSVKQKKAEKAEKVSGLEFCIIKLL
jgi:hypothetical protein